MSIMIWGHRGHRHHRYAGIKNPLHENSLKAYQQTLEVAMGIECDVVQSRSRTPYLIHDTLFGDLVQYALNYNLDEKSGELAQNRFIFQMNDGDLDQLKLRDRQVLPRLRRVLELASRFPDRYLNLELKGPDVLNATLRVVEKAIQDNLIDAEQIIFSSFNLPALRYLRQNMGNRFRIGACFAPAEQPMSPMYPNWPNAEQDAYYVPFHVDMFKRPDVQTINPDYFHAERGSLTTASLEALDSLFPEAKIILWMAGEPHPNDSEVLLDAVSYYAPTGKIHAVLSDFPHMVQEKLVECGLDILTPWAPYLKAMSD